MRAEWWRVLLGVVAGALLGARPSAASTFVLMSEADLAARSIAAVTGWVTDIEAAPDATNGGVNTYVHIARDLTVFGSLPPGDIVLREIGGRVHGQTEWIFGSAEYGVGEEVLVFLSQNADGSLRTTAMAMGKFSLQSDAQGQRIAVRHLGEGAAVWNLTEGRIEEHPGAEEYDVGTLLGTLRQMVEADPRIAAKRPSVRLAPVELTQRVGLTEHQESFTYLSTPSRWFEPDDGVPVTYAIDATGDVGLGPVTSRAAINDAFAAWTTLPTSSVALADGGTLATPITYAGCTGGNRIMFNDPFGEIADPTGCGGVLAIGGFCSSSETKTVNGIAFRRIRVGKVTFNNGWSSCPGWNRCNLSEVATHELGHTLGFGHTPDVSATMYASAHFDGRCASLRTDDINGANFVYPPLDAVTATPSPTVTPAPPTATPTLTSTPTRTNTPPPTATATSSRTPTHTGTATVPAPSATPTRTSTATATFTASWTATFAPPATATATPRPHYRVRGHVLYYAADRAVPDATVNLSGTMIDATRTSAAGDYEFAAVPEGFLELAAAKTDGFGGGISPLDAAYVLQTVATLRTLDHTQRLACDTTGDGQLSALDAVRILQFSVGMINRMPVATACGSDWLFMPEPAPMSQQSVIDPAIAGGSCRSGKIMIDELVSEASDQNFSALLFGDCTGNWQATDGAAAVRGSGRLARVRLGRLVATDGKARLPVYVRSLAPYHALDLEIAFDSTHLTPTAATLRRSAAGAITSYHVPSAGTLRVAMASGAAIERRSGVLMVIEFAVSGAGMNPSGAIQGVAANVDEQPASVTSAGALSRPR